MPRQQLTEYLAYLLARADMNVYEQLDRLFRPLGANVEQWRILKALEDRRGRSMSELANCVLMNHPTLTKTIDRMASNALVRRVPDPQDRRRVLILRSDRGVKLGRRLLALARTHEAGLIRRLGKRRAKDLGALLLALSETDAP
jgi:DNA-binding MarR family transcriptional regulator